jgi:hypothetical protein
MLVLPATLTAPASVIAAVPEMLLAPLNVTAPVPVFDNVPALLMPPPKTYGEFNVVLKLAPDATVTKPVKVLVPVVLLSVNVPFTVVVPDAVKLLDVMVSVLPAFTVRFLIDTTAFTEML